MKSSQPRLRTRRLVAAIVLAGAALTPTACGEPSKPDAEGRATGEITEISDAPDHVWCVSLRIGWLGEPRRTPGGAGLDWTFPGHPAADATYVECFPLETRYGKDVEISDHIAGYVREDVTTTQDGETWTRYRKVPFEEARRRHGR